MCPLNNRLMQSEIEGVFESMMKRNAAYQDILPFFTTMFLLQEAALETVRPEPVELYTEALEIKLRNAMPLLDRRQITIDVKSAQRLWSDICRAAALANAQLAAAASLLEAQQAHLRRWSRLLVSDRMPEFRQWVKKIGLDEDMGVFFVYHSVWPSLGWHARQCSGFLPDLCDWELGYCPVCGGAPALSYLDRDGQRYLICGFCRHNWQSQRIFCPYCNNRDAQLLHYFFNEEEKEYRVSTCERCHRYIKMVDTRQMARPFYPPAEALATAHLDIQAAEAGFSCGSPSFLLF